MFNERKYLTPYCLFIVVAIILLIFTLYNANHKNTINLLPISYEWNLNTDLPTFWNSISLASNEAIYTYDDEIDFYEDDLPKFIVSNNNLTLYGTISESQEALIDLFLDYFNKDVDLHDLIEKHNFGAMDGTLRSMYMTATQTDFTGDKKWVKR